MVPSYNTSLLKLYSLKKSSMSLFKQANEWFTKLDHTYVSWVWGDATILFMLKATIFNTTDKAKMKIGWGVSFN